MVKIKYCITKADKIKLKNLLDQYGYWSIEVREFLSNFNHFNVGDKLHNMAIAYEKYNQKFI